MTSLGLLKMIETVDPSNAAKLDEIDARVWCFLKGYKFAAAKHDRVFVLDENQCEIEKLNGLCTLKYTRSRDALKTIRPEGWTYTAVQNRKETEGNDGWRVALGTACGTPFLPTEELAELHASIQAIEYERERGFRNEI